jgi:hypothetical protein
MLLMYSYVLPLHSLIRWAVLLTGLWAAFRGLSGTIRHRPWTRADERAGVWFTTAIDTQFLLGLLLYFVFSPITRAAFHDFGAAMANPSMRFWAVEHITGMVIAGGLAHVGRKRIQKMGNDDRRQRTAAIFYTLSILVILASIPWPGRIYGRPLLRLP